MTKKEAALRIIDMNNNDNPVFRKEWAEAEYMDLILGFSNIITKDARPIHTYWSRYGISFMKKGRRRKARRQYKHYMRTERIQDFNRSQKLLTNWDFD